MKKITGIIATFAFIVMVGLTFTGCGSIKPLWSADFTQGNNDVFGLYGSVEENDDYITLKRASGQNYAGSTYFGQSSRNYEWVDGGMSVNLKLDIDTTDFADGDYSVWSLALNETDGTYITENAVFLIGTDNDVKFIYKAVGVDTDYDALANDQSAVSLASGVYTVRFDYNVNSDDEITLTIVVLNNAGTQVYKSADNAVVAIDHADHVAGTQLTQDDVAGLRYLWLARTTVDANVVSLNITK